MGIRRKLLVAVAAGLVASTSLSGIALAGPGADVNKDTFEGGHFISRELPNGKCLGSHHESGWEDPDFGPGGGDPVGNFTDFAAGGGELEFGLVTPSNQFNGQTHHPVPHPPCD